MKHPFAHARRFPSCATLLRPTLVAACLLASLVAVAGAEAAPGVGVLATPSVTVISGPSGTIAANIATVVFSVDDPTATAMCRLDRGRWMACASPVQLSGLTNGDHTLSLQAVDASDTGGAISDVSFTVDVPAPPAPPAPEPAPAPAPLPDPAADPGPVLSGSNASFTLNIDSPVQSATAGQTFPITVTASNLGDAPVQDAIVEVQMPAGVSMLGASAETAMLRAARGVSCSMLGRIAQCPIGTIPARGAVTISITVRAQRAIANLSFGLRATGANLAPVQTLGNLRATRGKCGVKGGRRLTGTERGDDICGSATRNAIRALAGDDYIDAAGGVDRVDAGPGNDVIVAGRGRDTIDAGPGDDVVEVSGGGVLTLGPGRDTVVITLPASITEAAGYRIVDPAKGEQIQFKRGNAGKPQNVTYNSATKQILIDPDDSGPRPAVVFVTLGTTAKVTVTS